MGVRSVGRAGRVRRVSSGGQGWGEREWEGVEGERES